MIGKKPTSAHQDAHNHQSRPLATLKDPDSFGPPPKNARYYGGAGIDGTPEYVDQGHTDHQVVNEARMITQEPHEALPPAVPFKADTTGLSTRNLPKPPIRHPGLDSTVRQAGAPTAAKPKPSLPPRLPPRQNSDLSQGAIPPQSSSHHAGMRQEPPEQNILNQSALNRLGAAGVSVPGFGIGSPTDNANPWNDEPSTSIGKPPSSSVTRAPAMDELQARFAKMSSSIAPAESSSQGTSFADKQAALRTASSFRNNPSSVSLSDARTAASTANNFRERHGDQVASGWQQANGLNKKYGLADRVSALGTNTTSTQGLPLPSPPASPTVTGEFAIQNKKPPPPPPKRITGLNAAELTAPPVPLSSKPRS